MDKVTSTSSRPFTTEAIRPKKKGQLQLRMERTTQESNNQTFNMEYGTLTPKYTCLIKREDFFSVKLKQDFSDIMKCPL